MSPASPRKKGLLKRVSREARQHISGVQRPLPAVARRENPYDGLECDSSPQNAPRARPVHKLAEISPLKSRNTRSKRSANPKHQITNTDVDEPRTGPFRHVEPGPARQKSPTSSNRSAEPQPPEANFNHGEVEGNDSPGELFVAPRNLSAELVAVSSPPQQVPGKRKRSMPSKRSLSPGPDALPAGLEQPATETTKSSRSREKLNDSRTRARHMDINDEPAPELPRIRASTVLFETVLRHSEDDQSSDDGGRTEKYTPKPKVLQRKTKKKAANGEMQSQRQPKEFSSPAGDRSPADALQDLALEEERDSHHFLGQWTVLRRILRDLDSVGVAVKDGEEQDRCDLEIEGEYVTAALDACHKAWRRLERLVALRSTLETIEQADFCAHDLSELQSWVEILCDKDPDHPAQLNSVPTVNSIYFHLFDKLVRLLIYMMRCFRVMDKASAQNGRSMSIGHLQTTADLIGLILDLGDGARKYVRPDPKLAIVRPVKSNILIPLRGVQKEFRRHLFELERARQQREIEAQKMQQRELEDQAERAEQRQKEEYEILRREWGKLHSERRIAEGDILTKEKQRHLRYKESKFEADQDGNLFERIQVFRRRSPGPSPSDIRKIREGAYKPWSTNSLIALTEGLHRWAGDDQVLTKIMRKHCGRHGLLGDRNVTEIVVAAADLKEQLSRAQEQEEGHVQDWVKKIPLWTEPRSLLGEENAEGIDEDDESEK